MTAQFDGVLAMFRSSIEQCATLNVLDLAHSADIQLAIPKYISPTPGQEFKTTPVLINICNELIDVISH